MDRAYEEAVLLAPAGSAQRGGLLLAWGESLLRRAAAGTGTRPVDRAESVLREALTCLPAGDAARERARILIGSVLALRFDRAGFLPDLYESRHLLDEAVRATPDPAVRAEVRLQLGRVQLQLSEAARDGQLVDALTAFRRAAEDSRAAHGDTPARSPWRGRSTPRGGAVPDGPRRPRRDRPGAGRRAVAPPRRHAGAGGLGRRGTDQGPARRGDRRPPPPPGPPLPRGTAPDRAALVGLARRRGGTA
ncbi:hypothetical protein O1L60_26155 [Streptomyces diastatochromogenes]|nr:hypothetical protein [Streptomyces diastatochromogenes]